ncbi:GNAT family N-acetyltransferase [Paenibacillus odorifer]|jgi:ribosomal-protein-alanine N-acetyltransferase|uniref:GNAT family N-acetyltransferase n=2 Tax=Paenibacillus odorifer TaxID=189426 RepID=UPI00349F2381
MMMLERNPIYLRELKFTDWQDVHAYCSQERVCRFQAWGPNTADQTLSFVNQAIEDSQKVPRTRFAQAIVAVGTEHLIGMIELNIRSHTDRSGEIGYIVHPDAWGQGVATAAARRMLKFGFEELQLHRIYATCDPRNSGSSKVLTKIGMTYEGRLRDALLIKDGWRDSLMFSMLEHEWTVAR